MGTPRFASEILENLLLKDTPIDCVFTQPDRPSGRKGKLKKSEVKLVAEKHGVEIAQFAKLDQEAINFLQQKKPDLIIVAAYGLILPKQVLELAKFGCINVHASVLPKLRGASPIHNALKLGLTKTGVSIMQMDSGIDTGAVFYSEEIKVKKTEKYLDLEDNLISLSNRILLPTLEKIVKGAITPTPQDHNLASLTKMIKKQDGLIDWKNQTAEEIFNSYRAFHVWPKVYTFAEEGKTRKKLSFTFKDFSNEKTDLPAGHFLQKDDDFLVSTISGSLILDTIQLEGKNKLSPKNFFNGKPDLLKATLK